jgi:DNA polymerase-3 subunit gamma/tau
MSYLVLARKYRPRRFSEMVGQGHVVQALSNALSTQRLHHAYLFTGTRGVGKTTVSRILAKSLNCQGLDGQGGITAEPCGVCQACSDIDSGRFVDYTELDAASNRGVDEVQALLEQAVYKPVQGRFKVFMIDEVHMLTNTAFNAMLKTLEEPPEYLKFVLATTDPQKVPVTVLSRCLQFNLRPMAPETIVEHLQSVLDTEAVPHDLGALRLLARGARGSMRDALSLTDQAIAFGSGGLQEDAVRHMLGTVDRSHVYGLIEALAQADGKTVVNTTEALRAQGLSATSTLEEMSLVLQRMAVLQAVPDAADENDPDTPQLLRLSQAMPADETQLLYSLCLQGRSELGLAPDEYAALTMVLLRLLAFKPGAMASSATQAMAPSAEKKTLKTATPETAATVSVAPVLVSTAPSKPIPSSAVPVEPAPAASAPGQPIHTGRVLPVVQAPQAAPVQAAPDLDAASQATLMSVPVRVAVESRADVAAQMAAPVSLQATEEGAHWQSVVQQLIDQESITALVRELALQSQLVARDAGHCLLRVERESLNQGSTRERLQQALQASGHVVQLSVEIGRVQDSPAKRATAAAQQRQQEAERLIHSDPQVQALIADFGAKILSIKPL